jgi:hypothetical protein
MARSISSQKAMLTNNVRGKCAVVVQVAVGRHRDASALVSLIIE